MSHNQKGTQVNHTTRSARTPFLRTGLFASLRGVLGGGGGSGAPSGGVGGSGAPSSGRVGARTPSLRLLALAAIPASAHRGLTAANLVPA